MLGEKEEKPQKILAVSLAIFSGCLFAIAATFGKIIASASGSLSIISLGLWISLITNLTFWGMIIAVISGSIFWIWALKEGRVSIVGPVQSGIMIAASVIIGIAYFNEILTVPKIGAILIISLGGVILSRRP